MNKRNINSLLSAACVAGVASALVLLSGCGKDNDTDWRKGVTELSARELQAANAHMYHLLDSASQVTPSLFQARQATLTLGDDKGRSFKVKLDMTLRPGGESRVVARLAFPPMVLGMATANGNTVHLVSKLARIDTTRVIKNDPVPTFAQVFCGLMPRLFLQGDDERHVGFQYQTDSATTTVQREVFGYRAALDLRSDDLKLKRIEATNDTLYGSLEVLTRNDQDVPTELLITAFKGQRRLGQANLNFGNVTVEW